MSDQTVGQPDSTITAASRTAGYLSRLNSWRQSPKAAWAAVGVLWLIHLVYCWRNEGGLANVVFTAAVTLTIALFIIILTRRPLFASVLSSCIVAAIIAGSTVKRQMMEMIVHAYDIVFYFSSWSTISYLWSDHRPYLLALVGSVLLIVLLGVLAWKLDPLRVDRSAALAAAGAVAAIAFLSAQVKVERRHTQFYWDDLFVSSFYISWIETLETMWRGTLIEAAAEAKGPRFALPGTCNASAKPPHILLIHQESVVPPSNFPQIRYDKSVDRMFQSYDGRLHKMRVETYGGASWLSEFSILAGVSTHSFGGMRQFVQSLMAGKLADTLPQTLQRCGYRNVVFYPMLRNFVSNAKFYTAIGMPEIFDMKDQGAKSVTERDRFYYTNALAEMERHFKASGQPLFVFLQTMATHSPYTFTYEPEVKVAGGPPGSNPEIHEYLRRLSMAHMDYDYMVGELKRRFPDEPFLIVHYGDHQPVATRTLLGYENEDPEDMTLAPDSPGFLTYFAVSGLNYAPPPLPPVEVLDVPYLGGVILEAARLPLSDSFKERRRLMAVCKGRYFTCPKKDEILQFHRRLIDSGLVEAR